MYCNNCGKELTQDAKFCPSCDTRTADDNMFYRSKNPTPDTVELKSKLAAGVLGILLGALGIHNFYLGYTEKAVAQLLLGTLGVFLIVGPAISGIWGLIEGILILTGSINTDGKGNPLRD